MSDYFVQITTEKIIILSYLNDLQPLCVCVCVCVCVLAGDGWCCGHKMPEVVGN